MIRSVGHPLYSYSQSLLYLVVVAVVIDTTDTLLVKTMTPNLTTDNIYHLLT